MFMSMHTHAHGLFMFDILRLYTRVWQPQHYEHLGQDNFFAVRNYPVPFKTLSSILGLYHKMLVVTPRPHSLSQNKLKMSPDIANCPLGDKTAPTRELIVYTHPHIHMTCALDRVTEVSRVRTELNFRGQSPCSVLMETLQDCDCKHTQYFLSFFTSVKTVTVLVKTARRLNLAQTYRVL